MFGVCVCVTIFVSQYFIKWRVSLLILIRTRVLRYGFCSSVSILCAIIITS